MADGFLFEARFDGIRLDVVSSQVSDGRDTVAHTFPKRDGADVEDQGRSPRTISLGLVFLDHDELEPGEGDYLDRFEKFEKLHDTGETRALLHPYLGTVRCKLSQFSHDADAERGPFIAASATLLEDKPRAAAFASGAGVQVQAGSADVSNSRIALDAERDALGLGPSPVAALAVEAAVSWEINPDTSARAVQLEAASLSNDLEIEMESIQIAGAVEITVGGSLLSHGLQKAYTLHAHAIRKASESFSSKTTRIVSLTVTEPLPLKIIAARFYSATQAEERAIEMRDLNPSVKQLSLIPAGTVLKAYSPQVSTGGFDS